MTNNFFTPKAVLFDWDGTLVDTTQMVVDSHNHVRTVYGLPAITAGDIFGRASKSARESYPEIYGADSPAALETLYKFVGDNHLSYLRPLPDAYELLSTLNGRGIPVGIVSNKSHVFLGREIQEIGWSGLIGAYIGAGEAAEDKPSALPLRIVMRQLDPALTSADILYVGDTETDLICARNADVACALLLGEYAPSDVVSRYSPRHVFHGLEELIQLLAGPAEKKAC